jgi:two-component system nitrate/nitrite response regulator NarL
MASVIRALVADDHPVYRDGLVHAWQNRARVEVISAVGDGHAALTALREVAPDVAVLDLKPPGIGGQELLEIIASDNIAVRPIILTGFLDSATGYRAISAGAMAFLEKAASMDESTDAIVQVAGGATVISPIAPRGLADALRFQQTGPGPTLARREIDILTRAADGGTTQDIATELHISVAAVKTHLCRACEKPGVSDRAAAVVQAIRRGLL